MDFWGALAPKYGFGRFYSFRRLESRRGSVRRMVAARCHTCGGTGRGSAGTPGPTAGAPEQNRPPQHPQREEPAGGSQGVSVPPFLFCCFLLRAPGGAPVTGGPGDSGGHGDPCPASERGFLLPHAEFGPGLAENKPFWATFICSEKQTGSETPSPLLSQPPRAEGGGLGKLRHAARSQGAAAPSRRQRQINRPSAGRVPTLYPSHLAGDRAGMGFIGVPSISLSAGIAACSAGICRVPVTAPLPGAAAGATAHGPPWGQPRCWCPGKPPLPTCKRDWRHWYPVPGGDGCAGGIWGGVCPSRAVHPGQVSVPAKMSFSAKMSIPAEMFSAKIPSQPGCPSREGSI